MTAEELIRTALALKGEMPETTDDYRGYALRALNIILAEMLPLENQTRYAKGEAELSAAPELSAFSDDVPYDAQLVKTCGAYGLAAKLTIEHAVCRNDTAEQRENGTIYCVSGGGYVFRSNKGTVRTFTLCAEFGF